MPRNLLVLAAFAAVVPAGCDTPKPVAPATHRADDDAHGHSHERDKMLLADAGPYHAALTAHLSSKEGNELDVLFETADDKAPQPVPLPLAKVTATARTADGKEHPLVFEPAPMDERKTDPAGKCSHFVAKAPWMSPADVLTVSATVEIEGKPRHVEWKAFNPKKYAHHKE
ncbi:MAG: hypothetical protein JWO38_2806 [Gemmataceae bacterium]|nr:hypothetical protein [Gemmataceae bacterium]